MVLGSPSSLLIAQRYRLEHEIGRGGMGVVWLGRDEVLQRPVALKRLAPDASDREARIAARLHHPNVVAVYDLVEHPSQRRWLVLEYVEGTTLTGLVRRDGPLRPEAAAAVLAQVAAALVAAKAAGITHRDVKPSNVLVGPDGVAKLSDFGIARSTGDATVTQSGLLVGSPAYVAPEVATGQGADHAADVWSLGATAYFLLTGAAPYDPADATEAGTALGTLYRIVHEEPPTTDAGVLTPLLRHTMVKDPARRWSVEEVEAFLRDGRLPRGGTRETAVVPPPAGSGSARRPNWLLLAAGAAAVVLLAAIAVVGYTVLDRSGDSGGGGAAAGQSPGPSEAGMKAFIRSYVRTVADNPDAAWTMLTPKFRQESGGFGTYRAFWDAATNGRVLSIQANPDDLTVSYHVHFDDFDNGPGPTILQLVYRDGRYLIDGESTKGFVPAR